ncbi:hypothetical protein BDN71DRAFT_1433987 [Pleurotus eryngii]|uniref:Uncharacterized protein n=1 Tax=Pleurotus eryngii TaxID=5323 RepID=A0A9P5ZPT4_PLEER|nr:hypothetical protein BDN71DRAFT_1433987 [Pleurotus eryngii]
MASEHRTSGTRQSKGMPSIVERRAADKSAAYQPLMKLSKMTNILDECMSVVGPYAKITTSRIIEKNIRKAKPYPDLIPSLLHPKRRSFDATQKTVDMTWTRPEMFCCCYCPVFKDGKEELTVVQGTSSETWEASCYVNGIGVYDNGEKNKWFVAATPSLLDLIHIKFACQIELSSGGAAAIWRGESGIRRMLDKKMGTVHNWPLSDEPTEVHPDIVHICQAPCEKQRKGDNGTYVYNLPLSLLLIDRSERPAMIFWIYVNSYSEYNRYPLAPSEQDELDRNTLWAMGHGVEDDTEDDTNMETENITPSVRRARAHEDISATHSNELSHHISSSTFVHINWHPCYTSNTQQNFKNSSNIICASQSMPLQWQTPPAKKWRGIVQKMVYFEKSLGFLEGRIVMHMLEVGDWVQASQPPPPVLEDIKMFGDQWWTWYKEPQPVGSINGFYSIVASLGWWVVANKVKRHDVKNDKQEADNQKTLVKDEWMAGALVDVDWVLQCMMSASSIQKHKTLL